MSLPPRNPHLLSSDRVAPQGRIEGAYRSTVSGRVLRYGLSTSSIPTQDERGGGAIVARARACIGARFRAHGRDPDFGLDCVGLAAVAFGRTVPGDYALRGGDAARISETIARLGLVPAERVAAGTLLLIAAGSGQFHLAVRTDAGCVHACARLRRVVETPGVPASTILGLWREGN